MKSIILFVIVSCLISCDDEQEPKQVFVNFDIDLYLEVKSESGVDLLNPENPDGFDFDQIKLFYIDSGEKVEFYNQELDDPRNIRLGSPSDFGLASGSPYRLILYSVIPESDNTITMYVKWNESSEDKIVCNLIRTASNSELTGSGSIRIAKVWINDEKLWDVESDPNQERLFTLMK